MILSIGCKGRSPLSTIAMIKTLRCMKLTIVLLLAASLQARAWGYSQKITLSVENGTLEAVFAEISKQADCKFVYTSNVQIKQIRITVTIKNKDLKAALNDCLAGLPFKAVIRDDGKTVCIEREESLREVVLKIAAIGFLMLFGFYLLKQKNRGENREKRKIVIQLYWIFILEFILYVLFDTFL
jgi:hypothetical protein